MLILSARPGSATSYKEEGDRIVLHTQTDVTRTVEMCKAMHNEGMHKVTGGLMKGAQLVGRYDINVIQQWAQARGLNYGDAMQNPDLLDRMVNDPDMSVFRVYKGRA